MEHQHLVQIKKFSHVITSHQHKHHSHQHVTTSHEHIYSQQSLKHRNPSHFKLAQTQRSQIRFILMAAFAYLLSPIDLVPEMIFGVFGIIDDIVFLFMCLFCVSMVLLYPVFRDARLTLFDKLSLNRSGTMLANKTF